MEYPKNEPARRFEAIRKGMASADADVMVVFGLQWKQEAIHYLSNYRMLGRASCVVLPMDKDPVLFISLGSDINRAAAESWVGDIRVFDGYDLSPVASCAGKLGKKCAINGLEIMSTGQYASFENASFAKIVNGYEIVDEAAKIKSEWEIGLLDEGGKIADIGFLAEIASIRSGLKEYELAADMNNAMLAAGADDNFQMLAAGKNLSCMHVPREKPIEPGDLILTEITPMKACITYAVQLCRTVKFGKANDVEYDKYMMLVEALEKALSIIKPGVTAGEVAIVQNKIIGAKGYEKYCKPPYMRSRGHNFGLGQFELTEDNMMEFRPGMAMVVHPNQFVPETGYLACGETVVVTENGIRRLSKLPAKLYEIEEVAG